MEYVWHLITANDLIVRSTTAHSINEARFKLAPIEPHQLVVSAMSHAVKETREVIASRGSSCDICGLHMHGERFGIYSNMHRACYEKDRRKAMTPEERQAHLEKRREYRNGYKREQRLLQKMSNAKRPLTPYEQRIIDQIQRDRQRKLAKEMRDAGTGTASEGD